MSGASSKRSPLFLELFLLSSACLVAQIPDYDLNDWHDGNLDDNSGPFFRTLSLQISDGPPPLFQPNQRLTIGGTITTASAFGNRDMALLTGKQGIFPSLNGSVKVTSNLALSGWYSGFASNGDVILASGYGLIFLPQSGETQAADWSVTFRHRLLEGPDDFFLKTIGMRVVRRINYSSGQIWLGVVSNHYSAGIHMTDSESGPKIRRKSRGQTNALVAGIGRSPGGVVTVVAEIKLHPSFVSFGVGVSKGIR